MSDSELINAPTDKLASQVLKGSGVLAEIVKARHGKGWDLLLDGCANSSVDLWSPSNLNFTYASMMGGVIDYYYPRGNPIKVLHLGAGALSIARYVESTRPGSFQSVVEIDEDLVDFVVEYLPLSPGFNMELLLGDAREVVEQLVAQGVGSYDLVVLDIYSGRSELTPLETLEFYELIANVLSPEGLLLVNVVDGLDRLVGAKPRDFSKDQLVTVKAALGDAILCINKEDYELDAETNMVLVGAKADRDLQSFTMPDGDRSALVLITGSLASEWMSSGKVLSDSGIK